LNRYDQALNDYRAGDFAAAVLGFQAAVADEPRHTPAHYHLGLALHQLGHTDEGIHHYRQLLKHHPDYLDAWINLGDLCGKAGQPDSAITAWHQALALDADSVLIINNLGLTCLHIGLQKEALNYFRQAAAIEPDRPDLWVWLGNIQLGLAQYNPAAKAYRQALRLNPEDAQVRNNLAVTLGNLTQEEASLSEYRQALAIDPDLADGLNNLALALHKRDEREEAEQLLRHCTTKHPQYALGWANLGMVQQGMGKLGEAIAAIDRALILSPNQSGWIWNQSLAYLTLGDFEHGWAGFEARYAPERGDANFTDLKLPFPMWQGEPLAGKRILLVKEQGFGDQIQCLRFAVNLKDQGASIGAWVHPALVGIVASMPEIDDITIEAPQGGYDYWAYLMSVPARLSVAQSGLPGKLPYLFANDQKSTLAGRRIDGFAQGRRKIAINWAGNSSHPNDHNRSLATELLEPWLSLEHIAWISVQKDRGANAEAWVQQGTLLDLGREIADFTDTAAILANVDLLITIDSAVAHLAGAIGMKTWLLLPENADYRWMRECVDTPWYPSVTLWRQKVLGDWQSVVDEVTVALCDGAFGLPETSNLPNPVVEAMVRRESTLPPEVGALLPMLNLAESPASAASWGKWLLMAAFFFELIMFMSRR
jgi:tetratricopeptide (TPR) repeat protein/ADP-heptose:LPS heptosyltransferase